MLKPIHLAGTLAFSLALLTHAPLGHAQSQKPGATKKQAEIDKATVVPLAISDSHTQELMQSFSNSNTINSQTTGAQLYAAICQGCHMPQGEGAQGVGFYPPLANSVRVSAGAYVGVVILRGLHAMPAFGDRLNDAQVAEVVNYVRTNFGNNYTDPISVQDVTQLRQTLSSP